MLTFEEKFKAEFPDARVVEEIRSEHHTLYHVYVGEIHCSDSGVRDNAFHWALEDVKTGKLKLPPKIEQFELWPLRG